MNEVSPAPDVEVVHLLDSLPEPRVCIDADYRIVAVNAAYRREFGDADPVGRTCYEVSHHFHEPCDLSGESCPLHACRSAGEARRVLHVHHTRLGPEHVEVETVPIRGADGSVRYFLETLRTLRHAGRGAQARELVGHSRVLRAVLELGRRVAETEAAVLLLGESGTGKELLAHAIHDLSARSPQPFVALDCAGLSENLFESELFGHERGAFTGALSRKTGLVEAAGGGTLFLDEIGDVPPGLQVKLLRLIEAGTYRRVGGVEALRADFRLICATHRDLRAMVGRGEFRRDLYHRINVFPIRLPALRERREDIPLLVASLLARLHPQRPLRISSGALEKLAAYDYPGNVRELRNLVERACILADGDLLQAEHIRFDDGVETSAAPAAAAEGEPVAGPWSPAGEVLPLADVEQRYLRWASERFAGDRRGLAQALGISERTLYRRLAEVPAAGDGG